MTLARSHSYPAAAPSITPIEEAAIAAPRTSSRRLSYAALLVAAGLTGVYAESIPNLEVLTLVVFCSGVLLGAGWGMAVGALSMAIFSGLNPYGPAHPVVMASQIVGIVASGAAGALFHRAGFPAHGPAVRAWMLGVCAIVLTAFFDFITNLASGLVFGQVRATLIGGIPFSLWHIGYNVLFFAVLGTPLVAVFARYSERLER